MPWNPSLHTRVVCYLTDVPGSFPQVLKGRSHALLQEAGVDLSAIVREEGFYVTHRQMSSPLAKRGRETFGAAAPIELPTIPELDRFAEQ